MAWKLGAALMHCKVASSAISFATRYTVIIWNVTNARPRKLRRCRDNVHKVYVLVRR